MRKAADPRVFVLGADVRLLYVALDRSSTRGRS
jgi:hypothetical protein